MTARWRQGFMAFLICVFLAALSLTAVAQTADLTLLHINDVYEISPKRGQGGFAQLMTLLQQERARTTHHLTTFGGDLLSPSVMSSLKQGAQMIELMNAIGVDVAAIIQAAAQPRKASAEPTERSMWPRMISIVMPQAKTPITDACVKMVEIDRGERKLFADSRVSH